MIKKTKENPQVKSLGVVLDHFLTIQREVQNILRKKACGIEILHEIKNKTDNQNQLRLFKALVTSHLQYSATILNSFTSDLIISLEKQMNWAIKVFCNRKKT